MTALKYNNFLDHPNPKPPKMRFGLSAYFFADISNAFRMSPKRLADNSAPFEVFKKMFADNYIAFEVSKKMFADNSDAFGMSLNRILLLQTFRNKFLFGVFALGAASMKR